MPPKKKTQAPTADGAPVQGRLRAHELRLRKEFAEGMNDLPTCITTLIPDQTNIGSFKITVDLKDETESYWHKGKYVFNIETPKEYPMKAPKVTLDTPIYHPNIDTNGAVCLNILRKDWMPVNTMNMIAIGLLFLFQTPEPTDPLNHKCAEVMRDNLTQWKKNCETSLKGGTVDGVSYAQCKFK